MNAVPAVLSFNFEGSELRGFEHEGEAWFFAQDVCSMLGHSNTSKSLANLDEDEKGITFRDTLGGPQQLLIVSESGVYALAFRSRKQNAKRFRRWVTQEVLPTIRKTGRYEAPDVVPSEDQPAGTSDLEMLRLRLATVNTAHRIYGAAAARTVWEQLGFPKVEPQDKNAALLYEIPDPEYDKFLLWLEERTDRVPDATEGINSLATDFGNWWRRRYPYNEPRHRLVGWFQRIDPAKVGVGSGGVIIGIRLKD